MLVDKIYCKTKQCVAGTQMAWVETMHGTCNYEACTACGELAIDGHHAFIKVMEPEPVKARICTLKRYSDQVVCNVCNMTFDAGDEITGCPNPDVFL